MLNARFGPLFDNIFFVELHIAAIQNGILWRTDVNKRGFHSW